MSSGSGSDVDFFGLASDPPGPLPVHEIVVLKAVYSEPGDEFGIDPSVCEYTVHHGACPWRGEECLVSDTVRDLGLHQALFGVWDRGEGGNRLRVGTYRVRGWVSHTPATPNGPEEWDAGIELVEDDEE